MQINVYGGGVMGLCIATELAGQQHDVQIYELAPKLGPASCSWWAGGMLAPWCEGESAEEPVVRHGCASIDWWQSQTGCVKQRGTLVLAMPRDRAELTRFAKLTQNKQPLNREQISELEPALDNRFEHALFFQDEAHLDPRLALQALEHTLQAQGVKINYTIDTISSQGIRPADITIDATGLAARRELSGLRGVKGEMIVLHCPDVQLNRTIRLLHPRFPIYLVPRDDNYYMLGATMIENDERQRISTRSMLELLGAVYTLHPAFAEAEVVEIGVDARPAFEDNLPRLCWQNSRLYANGLYRHGFLLAPAIARMAAEVIADPDSKPEFFYEN